MKFFVLVYKNIKYYISSSKMVFSLFVVGMISCTFLMIYLYGNYNSVKEIYHDQDNRTYTLTFPSSIEFSEWEEYEKEIEDVINHSYSSRIYEYAVNGETFIEPYGRYITCKSSDRGTNDRVLHSGRTYFTEEEIAIGEKVAIINESLYIAIERKCGQKVDYSKTVITIDGVDFRIIGTTSNGTDITLPYKTYKDIFASANYVSIEVGSKPKYYDNLEFVEKIEADFESRVINIKTPYSDYEDVKGDTPIALAIFGAVFVLISMTFMCLIKYLSDETNHISVIQYVCGASKETVASIKVMTVFLLTVFSGGLGVLLHALVHKPFLSKIDIVEGLFYTFYEYMLILSVVCVSAVIVVIPFIIGFSKNSVITNKNKYK